MVYQFYVLWNDCFSWPVAPNLNPCSCAQTGRRTTRSSKMEDKFTTPVPANKQWFLFFITMNKCNVSTWKMLTSPCQISDYVSLPCSSIITAWATSLKHFPVACCFMKYLGLLFSDICVLETLLCLWQSVLNMQVKLCSTGSGFVFSHQISLFPKECFFTHFPHIQIDRA